MNREQIKRLFNFVIGFGLAAALLWVFLKDADWAKVWDALGKADITFLAIAFLMHILSLVIRTWRWRLLLSPIKPDLPLGPVWRFFNIGFAVTSLLPGRIGELLRPYLLAKDQKISFTSTFATVVTERVVDLVMVLALLGTIFIFPSALGNNSHDAEAADIINLIKGFGLLALLVAVIVILFLVLLKSRTEWALGIVRFLTKPLPDRISEKLLGLVRAFADGIGGLRGLRQVGLLVGSTVLNWMVVTFGFWIALLGFGFSEVPFHHTFFLLAVVALGVVVPTPAGTGTYHAAVIVVASGLWGLSYNDVVSYAITNHLITFVPVVIFGIYYLSKGGINIFATARSTALAEQSRMPTPGHSDESAAAD